MTVVMKRMIFTFLIVAGVIACESSTKHDMGSTKYDIGVTRHALETMCAQYAQYNWTGVNNKEYVVQSNVWNPDAEGTQCLDVDSSLPYFQITRAVTRKTNPENPDDYPLAYPSIFKGCHYGNCTSGSKMPILVDDITAIPTSWDFSVPSDGLWNATAELWFDTTSTQTSHPDGAELMVWFDSTYDADNGILLPRPAGTKVSGDTPVDIGGALWDVWYNPSHSSNAGGSWDYIAFVRVDQTQGFFDLAEFDLKDFVDYCMAQERAWVDPDWYLLGIEAGFEVLENGVGLTTNSFGTYVDDTVPNECSDGIMNQDETDVDCGGSTCDACEAGKTCIEAGDCVSGICEENVCQAQLSCDDGVMNQDETDVDCGGSTCGACGAGKTCIEAGDCLSASCVDGVCEAPTNEVTAKVVVDNEWNSGFCVSLIVSNEKNTKISTWTLTVDMKDSSMVNGWNANYVGPVPIYTVTPLSWNSNIDPNQSVSASFCAEKTGSDWIPEIVSVSGE